MTTRNYIFRSLTFVMFTALLQWSWMPRVSAQAPIDLPKAVFQGCDDGAMAPPVASSPRDRTQGHAQSGRQSDRIASRTFASFSLDEIDQSGVDENAMRCWKRLDGVWREAANVVLDHSVDFEGWGSDQPELMSMANGTYTTPGHLVIDAPRNKNEVLFLRAGLGESDFVKFVSTDGVSLDKVLTRGGVRKTYRANREFEFGSSMSVDVSRSGRVRIKLGKQTFIRPKPGVSSATMSTQLAVDDAFLLSYNLENLSASRRGYDITSQDPFFLIDNPKSEVFAEAAAYAIKEKRTVPLGFTLLQEVSQGTVYRQSLVTSEVEIQETIGHSYGSKVSGTAKVKGVEVGASGGSRSAQEQMRSMRNSETVGQAVAYSRSKQYALVVDHPFISLSDDFIDAVEDARRYSRYQSLIDKFGTHYPYAVTYGAAAKMTKSFGTSEYEEIATRTSDYKSNAGGSVFGVGGSSHHSSNTGQTTGSRGSIGSEDATFVAVGGNGSWDQNGYSAGATPYPVLLDLRPIYELLNPINFPDEPEVYDGVRNNLRNALGQYTSGKADQLSGESLLPIVEYEEPKSLEKWYVYAKYVTCTGANDWLVNKATGELAPTIEHGDSTLTVADSLKLSAPCKNKKTRKKMSYGDQGKKVVVLQGTREEIAKKVVKFDLAWAYTKKNGKKKKGRRNKKAFNAKAKEKNILRTGKLKVGKTKDYNWVVGAKGLPEVRIVIRFKRKR